MKKKWVATSQRIAAIPVPAILFVLALGLFLWGLYACTPWYEPGTPIQETFGHSRGYVLGVGIFYMGIAAYRPIGILVRSRTMELTGAFLLMMGYLFLAILRVVTVGWVPVSWFPLVVCSLIAGICRLSLLHRREIE